MFWHSREGMTNKQLYRWQWVRSLLINVLGMGLPHINDRLRKFLFRLAGLKVGKGGFIGMHGCIDDFHTYRITIGDNVTISFRVTLVTHGPRPGRSNMNIVIEDGAYIGCNAVVLPGVTIGKGAGIGAGSVVTKDIPPGAVAAGVPCRVLRSKDEKPSDESS